MNSYLVSHDSDRFKILRIALSIHKVPEYRILKVGGV